jgi:RNA polymerase sigma factor (sigma-70 family)
MSRPFAAKGAGACLKHVLNARLAPASSRNPGQRDGADDQQTDRTSGRTVARRLTMVREAHAGLPEGDPLPPEDRVAVASSRLEVLYRAHRPRLLRFLSRRTSNDNAQDVAQQAFTRLAALDDEMAAAIGCPVAYLRRTANNLLKDEAKHAARHFASLHVSIDDVSLVAPDQLAALEARDLLARLEAAINRLKPRTREIFLAHRIDGLSYGDIAHRTGLSVKAVEKHMSKAIVYLNRHVTR